jgi:UDP:flavonoid glycosyltransferase YjiC (YdhE family)
VYVSFGSVAGHMGFYPDFYRRVLGALADVPARVLMTLGAGLDPTALGEVAANVHVESWWPQEDVMREASAVVSHGGFGTLMATLAHGLPQVVVPLFSADQYANAERVATSGVGVSLSPGDPLVLRSADLVPSGPDLTGLSAAVVRTLHDRAVQDAAQTVAAEIARLPETAEFLRLLP